MTETSGQDNTTHPDTDDLYPPHHSGHLFTNEEIQDILRFAQQHDLQGVNKAKLLAFMRNVRAAHLRRARSKGKPAP